MAVELAKAVSASDTLNFGGLHVYHGGIQHVRRVPERLARVDGGPAAAATATVAALEAAGIHVPCVTGGGTGTILEDLSAGTHNEVQPGSYLFMDGDYGANDDASDKGFVQALFLHATVIHCNEEAGKRVVDCGSKAVDLVSGMPKPSSLTDLALASRLVDATYKSGGDEHGILLGVSSGDLPVGSTVQLVPSHCDPTVNLHDWLIGVRDGMVEVSFEIDARGPG